MINGMILILLIFHFLTVMSLGVPLMVYIFLNLFALQEHLHVLMTSIINNRFLSAKLLKQGYRYHKLRKAFSKFYRRHFELIEKISCQSEETLQQGISNPEFYGDCYINLRKSLEIQTSLISLDV